MIRITETMSEETCVEVRLDGVLNDAAVPLVANVCRKHLDRNEKVVLNLIGLLHINRNGRSFLYGLKDQVSIINQPEFMELEQLADAAE